MKKIFKIIWMLCIAFLIILNNIFIINADNENEITDKYAYAHAIDYISTSDDEVVLLDDGNVYFKGLYNVRDNKGIYVNSFTKVKSESDEFKNIKYITGNAWTFLAINEDGVAFVWGRYWYGWPHTESTPIARKISVKEGKENNDKEINPRIVSGSTVLTRIVLVDDEGKVYSDLDYASRTVFPIDANTQYDNQTVVKARYKTFLTSKGQVIDNRKYVLKEDGTKLGNIIDLANSRWDISAYDEIDPVGVALDKNGEVWTWGKQNDSYGTGKEGVREYAKKVLYLDENNEEQVLKDVVKVYAEHTGSGFQTRAIMTAITKNGEVYAWGKQLDNYKSFITGENYNNYYATKLDKLTNVLDFHAITCRANGLATIETKDGKYVHYDKNSSNEPEEFLSDKTTIDSSYKIDFNKDVYIGVPGEYVLLDFNSKPLLSKYNLNNDLKIEFNNPIAEVINPNLIKVINTGETTITFKTKNGDYLGSCLLVTQGDANPKLLSCTPENNSNTQTSSEDKSILLRMDFNQNVKFGTGSIKVYNCDNNKLLYTKNANDLSKNDLPSTNKQIAIHDIPNDTKIYVTIDSGFFVSDSTKLPFKGVKKNDWTFTTTFNKFEFPKYLKVVKDDSNLPQRITGNDNDYAKELRYWLKQTNFQGDLSLDNCKKMLEYDINTLVKDENNQTYIVNYRQGENKYSKEHATVKDFMRQIIFSNEIKKKLDEFDVQLKTDVLGKVNYSQYYDTLMNLYINYDNYFKNFDSKANIISLVERAFIAETCMQMIRDTDGINKGYKFINSYATLSIDENDINNKNNLLISILQGDTSNFNIGNIIKNLKQVEDTSKSLIKAKVNNAGTGTYVKIAFDSCSSFVEKSDNSTLKSIYNTVDDAVSFGSFVKTMNANPIFATGSLTTKYISEAYNFYKDKTKEYAGWYLTLYYQLSKTNPDLIDPCFNPEDMGTPSFINFYDKGGYLPDNQVSLRLLQELVEENGMFSGGIDKIGTPKDEKLSTIYNVAEFYADISKIDFSEVQYSLSKNISTTINKKSKVTDVRVECPVDVNIYKGEELITTVSNGVINNEGFEDFVVYLEGDNLDKKHIIFTNDEYNIKIVPKNIGKMNVSIKNIRDDSIVGIYNYNDIDIGKNSFSLDYIKKELKENNNLIKPTIEDTKSNLNSISVNDIVIDKGKTVLLQYNQVPNYSTDYAVSWKIYNDKIANINCYGEITGVEEGNTIGKCIYDENILCTFKVEVSKRREAPSKIQVIKNDDKMTYQLTNVTNEMEFKRDSDNEYKIITENNVKNLKEGIYYIRYYETEYRFASESIKIIIKNDEDIIIENSENSTSESNDSSLMSDIITGDETHINIFMLLLCLSFIVFIAIKIVKYKKA